MGDVGEVLELMRQLLSPDPREREVAADQVSDLGNSLQHLGPAVAAVLAAARLNETDQAAQESQLNALAELNEAGFVFPAVLEIISRLDPPSLVGSQIEHYEELLGR